MGKSKVNKYILKHNTMKNNKNQNYNARLNNVLNTIFEWTMDDRGFREGFNCHKFGNLFGICGKALCDLGIVVNLGNSTKPVYCWSSPDTPDEIFDTIKERIKEINRYYNRNNPRMKSKCSKKFQPKPEVAEPDMTMATPQNFVSTDTLSDQQLWDELKRRHYFIVDNKLCRQEFLQ